MSLSDALKSKIAPKHLSTIINSDGVEVEVEKREDEQQVVKYFEIIELLISAGYFRAKIKGISEFDKVVGGMTWCIDVCNIDLDVDLLFQENSTIGQKISVTEKIVTALQKMGCPFMIEPHQIQGLDFVHIFPVVQWLVKKSFENREERGDYLKQYAIHRFNCEFCIPGEKPNENFIKRALPHIAAVQNKYTVQRKFRRAEGLGDGGGSLSSDPLTRVQSTLFEYGHTPVHQKEEENEGDVKHIETVDEVKLKQMIKMMTSTSNEIKLAPKAVTDIINLQSNEIIDATKTYDSLVADTKLSDKAEIRRLKGKEASLLELKADTEDKLTKAYEIFNNLKTGSNFREETTKHLSEKEKKTLNELESRILVMNKLIHQEQEFREYCKTEKTSFEALIREVEEYSGLSEEGALDEGSALEAQLADVRMSLAKVSRMEAKLHRLIDQVPSRPELNQYQRRFIELYNQVSAKYKETKQYYTLYNSMSDQHEYLAKELKLLDSILEGYTTTVISSPHAKEEFINKFEMSVDVIKQNKAKVEMKRNEERDMKERLRGQLFGLIEQQRQYASLLKQFRDECELNESLVSKVKAAA